LPQPSLAKFHFLIPYHPGQLSNGRTLPLKNYIFTQIPPIGHRPGCLLIEKTSLEEIGRRLISLFQAVESIYQNLAADQAGRSHLSFGSYLMCEKEIIQHIFSMMGVPGA